MKNLAVIVLDSVRFDQYEQADTPFLGQAFKTRSHADQTFPSHAQLLCGNLHLRPDMHPKTYLFAPWMPTWFKKKGYHTIAGMSVPWLRKQFFGLDFDHYFYIGFDNPDLYLSLGRMLNSVKECLTNEPTFLFMNVGETHFPYTINMKHPAWQAMMFDLINRGSTVAPSVGEKMREQQIGTINWLDAQFRQFFSDLDKNWIIYVTSDHGEFFGEEQKWLHGHGCHEIETTIPVACNDWDGLMEMAR